MTGDAEQGCCTSAAAAGARHGLLHHARAQLVLKLVYGFASYGIAHQRLEVHWPRHTSQDVIAMRRDSLSTYVQARCGTDFGCPACAAAALPSITAVCREGRCTVVDLSQDPMTACTQDDECRVRSKDCCDCGGSLSDLVAIAAPAAGSYIELVCEEGWGCDACVPTYTQAAGCDGGHCVVELF